MSHPLQHKYKISLFCHHSISCIKWRDICLEITNIREYLSIIFRMDFRTVLMEVIYIPRCDYKTSPLWNKSCFVEDTSRWIVWFKPCFFSNLARFQLYPGESDTGVANMGILNKILCVCNHLLNIFI